MGGCCMGEFCMGGFCMGGCWMCGLPRVDDGRSDLSKVADICVDVHSWEIRASMSHVWMMEGRIGRRGCSFVDDARLYVAWVDVHGSMVQLWVIYGRISLGGRYASGWLWLDDRWADIQCCVPCAGGCCMGR